MRVPLRKKVACLSECIRNAEQLPNKVHMLGRRIAGIQESKEVRTPPAPPGPPGRALRRVTRHCHPFACLSPLTRAPPVPFPPSLATPTSIQESLGKPVEAPITLRHIKVPAGSSASTLGPAEFAPHRTRNMGRNACAHDSAGAK